MNQKQHSKEKQKKPDPLSLALGAQMSSFLSFKQSLQSKKQNQIKPTGSKVQKIEKTFTFQPQAIPRDQQEKFNVESLQSSLPKSKRIANQSHLLNSYPYHGTTLQLNYTQQPAKQQLEIDKGRIGPIKYPFSVIQNNQKDSVMVVPILPFQEIIKNRHKLIDRTIKSATPQEIFRYAKQFQFDSNCRQILENRKELVRDSGLFRIGKVRVYKDRTVIKMGDTEMVIWDQEKDNKKRQVVRIVDNKLQKVGKIGNCKILMPLLHGLTNQS